MDTQVTAWLNEGLKYYAGGDHARALEFWYRILEVEPEHPAALEYVSFLRDTVRIDAVQAPPNEAGPGEAASTGAATPPVAAPPEDAPPSGAPGEPAAPAEPAGEPAAIEAAVPSDSAPPEAVGGAAASETAPGVAAPDEVTAGVVVATAAVASRATPVSPLLDTSWADLIGDIPAPPVEVARVEPAVVLPTAVVETAVVELTAVVEPPAVETPVIETPVIETPVVELTAVVEPPAVETPAVETPAVETPAVETPAVETPAVEPPAVEPPAVETPSVPVAVDAPFDIDIDIGEGPSGPSVEVALDLSPLPLPEPWPPAAVTAPLPEASRWSYPKVVSTTPPPSATFNEFEPLQPFDFDPLDAVEPEPLIAERPGAGFTSRPVMHAPAPPPAIALTPPPAPPPPLQDVVETPVIETPVIEASVVETPVIETPVIETPIVEAPVVEAPVVEAPVVEAPVVEAPVVEAPVVEADAQPHAAAAIDDVAIDIDEPEAMPSPLMANAPPATPTPAPRLEGASIPPPMRGPAPPSAPDADPWASVPGPSLAARPADPEPSPAPSPVLRPSPAGEVYRSGAAVDVVPGARSEGTVEERVIRQSVRYDEPGEKVPAYTGVVSETAPPPVTSTTAPLTPAIGATAVVTTAAVTTGGASPWDGDDGPARTVDLDTLLGTSSLPRAFTPAPVAAPAAAAAVTTTAPPEPVDELEALMTGARELFALGDFSGSLELVEKVLKANAAHEGARAYLKRNEATLLKMYESKVGHLGNVPSQLVPPDEVIWLNMHHRAGFILSQVDGTLTYEDLLDVSGMDRFDTIRILADLVQNGIIGVR